MQDKMPDRDLLRKLLTREFYDAFFDHYDAVKEIAADAAARGDPPPLLQQLPDLIYKKFATAVMFLDDEKLEVGSEPFFDLLEGHPWLEYLTALHIVMQRPDRFVPEVTADPDCLADWRRIGACYTVRAGYSLIKDIKPLYRDKCVAVNLCVRICNYVTMLYVTTLTLKLPEMEQEAVRVHLGKGARKIGRSRQEGMEIVARLAAEILEKNAFLRFTSRKKFGQINRSSLAYAIVERLKGMARAGEIQVEGPPDAFDLEPQTIADEYLRPLIEGGVVK